MGFGRQNLLSHLRPGLAKALPEFLVKQRWFGGKARPIRSAEIVDAMAVPFGASSAYLTLVQVTYTESKKETYVLPLISPSKNWGDLLKTSDKPSPELRVRDEADGKEVVFYDALWDSGFADRLLELIDSEVEIAGEMGSIVSRHTNAIRRLWDQSPSTAKPSLMRAEQSNTSVAYGDRLILKFFRRLEEGINPDLEIGAFLTENVSFPHIPPMAGAIEFRQPGAQPSTLAFLQGFVVNQGDAWRHTLRALQTYFPTVAAQAVQPGGLLVPRLSLRALSQRTPPAQLLGLIGTYLQDAQLLGQRTAELHVALASDSTNPAFAPEPFSQAFQDSLSQAMQDLASQVLPLLRKRRAELPWESQQDAQTVLSREGEIGERFRSVAGSEISAMRTRLHGDYHLGQVLFTGSDFVIIDFEGEPARPLIERRAKRSPLQDVAGMLRSFHYAALTGLMQYVSSHPVDTDRFAILEGWAQFWYAWVSASFLKGYFAAADRAPFLPWSPRELDILLNAFLLEKAVYELGYELNNRPDWVGLPLRGILHLLEQSK